MSKDPSANKHFAVLEKILPYLIRQGKDREFGNKTWEWQALADVSGVEPVKIRAAISDIEKRYKPLFSYDGGKLKFSGPPDLNFARLYAKWAKAPSTDLAEDYRKHGVYLTTQLMPQTSWMRETDKRINHGRQEVVLTLDQSLIKMDAGVVRYSSLEVPDDSWETRAANKSRTAALQGIVGRLKKHIRVIRIDGQRTRSGRFSITNSRVDKNYWVLEQVTPRGRIVARRTDQKAILYDLAVTELGVPAMLCND